MHSYWDLSGVTNLIDTCESADLVARTGKFCGRDTVRSRSCQALIPSWASFFRVFGALDWEYSSAGHKHSLPYVMYVTPNDTRTIESLYTSSGLYNYIALLQPMAHQRATCITVWPSKMPSSVLPLPSAMNRPCIEASKRQQRQQLHLHFHAIQRRLRPWMRKL